MPITNNNCANTITILLIVALQGSDGTLKNEVTFNQHLTFNIDLDRVRVAYDSLQDTLKHVINLQKNVPTLKSQEEEVRMVWDKLEILCALIQHDQIRADVD